MGNRELSRLSQTTIRSNGWIRKTLCNRHICRIFTLLPAIFGDLVCHGYSLQKCETYTSIRFYVFVTAAPSTKMGVLTIGLSIIYIKWAMQDLNLRLPACKAGALAN